MHVISTEQIMFICGYLVSFQINCVASTPKTCSPTQGEVLVRSETTGSHQGTFRSPVWPRDNMEGGRCVYRFVAGVGQKVHIVFREFKLNGRMPICKEDFLDVYIDVASSSLDLDRRQAQLHLLASGEPATTTPFSAAVYSTVLDKSPLLGRYCSDSLENPSQEFVSLHREIVLDYFVDAQTEYQLTNRDAGFSGTFEFINDSAYYPGKVIKPIEIGLDPKLFSGCLFQIDPDKGQNNRGTLISPLYPGVHPDGLYCAYQLIGRPNQRISVEILELNTIGRIGSCPIDQLLFYDGLTVQHNTPIINSPFCGQQRRIRIVSSGSNLLVMFITGLGLSSNEISRRGFNLKYSFSETLPIHPEYRQFHIRGSECDYVIRGHPDTMNQSGSFESPNYFNDQPIAGKRTCNFFFIGSILENRLQVPHIQFDQVNLPKAESGSINLCEHGFLAVYGAMSLDHPYQLASKEFVGRRSTLREPDYRFCGVEDTKRLQSKSTELVSRHSTMVLQLNASSEWLYASFKLKYRFGSGFAIPGLQLIHNKCRFAYKQSSSPYHAAPIVTIAHHSGWTNSPFYPDAYPSDTSCVYVFVADPGKSVRLAFETFALHRDAKAHPGVTGTVNLSFQLDWCSQSDYVEIIAIKGIHNLDDVKQLLNDIPSTELFTASGQTRWRQIWKSITFQIQTKSRGMSQVVEVFPQTMYCGNHTPGPVDSGLLGNTMLLRFVSNRVGSGEGFRLKYEFREITQPAGVEFATSTQVFNGKNKSECGLNVSLSGPGGFIQSPNYPSSYPSSLHCVWTLKGQRITGFLLHFEHLNLVGNRTDCSKAVIRVWDEQTGNILSEICGKLTLAQSMKIPNSSIRIEFLTTENVDKATGFRLIWTQLIAHHEGACQHFECQHSLHCISNEVLCDGLPNCGHWFESGRLLQDRSDEEARCSTTFKYNLWHIGTGISLTLFLLFFIIIVIYHRERKRHKKLPIDPLVGLSGSKHSLVSNPVERGQKSVTVNNNRHRGRHRQPRSTLERPKRMGRAYQSTLVRTAASHRHQQPLLYSGSLTRNHSTCSRKSATHGSMIRLTTTHHNSSDVDGGVLIREKMQKISIV